MTTAAIPSIQPDNLLGICHRAAADLGIDPLWLRLGFCGALIFAPVLVLAAYLALGVVVLIGRLVFRDRPAAVPARPAPAAVEPLPLAA